MYFTLSKNTISKCWVFSVSLIIAFVIILYTYITCFYDFKQNYLEQSIMNNNGMNYGDCDVEGTTAVQCVYSQSKIKVVLVYFTIICL